jgi:uncharacterized protein
MKSKRRIVFDTNALISAAILPGSISNQALTIAVEHFQLIVSEQTWLEFESRIQKPKLFPYFGSVPKREDVVMAVNRAVVHVTVESVVSDCSDPDDNKFLALALDGGAAMIVSGDQDLLALHPWRRVEIMTTGDFVRKYSKI